MSRAAAWAAVWLFVAAAVGFHLLYFAYDRRGLIDHDLYYTAPFVTMHDLLDAGDLAGFARLGVTLDYPLMNGLLAMWTWALGLDYGAYFSLSLPFLVALILLAAWLGEQQAGPLGAALGALAAATCPMLDNASRKYFVEFHAMVFALAAVCLARRAAARGGGATPAALAGVGALLGASFLAHPASAPQALPAGGLALWAIARTPASWRRRAALAGWLALPAAPAVLWVVAHFSMAQFFVGAASRGAAFPNGQPGSATLAGWAADFLVAGGEPWLWLWLTGLAALAVNLKRRRSPATLDRASCLGAAAVLGALSYLAFAEGHGLHYLVIYPLLVAWATAEIVRLLGPLGRARRALRFGAAAALLALTALGFADKFRVWAAQPRAEDLGSLRFSRRFVGHTPYFSNTLAAWLAAQSSDPRHALRVDIAPASDAPTVEFLSAKSPCLHLSTALRLSGIRLDHKAGSRWLVRAAFGQRADAAAFLSRETARAGLAGAAPPSFLAGVDELGEVWLAAVRPDRAAPPPGGYDCDEQPTE